MVEVGVDYTSDLKKVEEVTLAVARDSLSAVEGGVEKFEPMVRFHTFDDSSINYTVYLRCHEFYQHIELRHEFIKRLKERFDSKGITIPFPIRTVYLKKD